MNVEVAIEEVPGISASEPADTIFVLALREHKSGCFRVRPIALHVLSASDPNFSDLTIWEVGHRFVVNNPDFDIAPGLSGRAQKMGIWPARVMV